MHGQVKRCPAVTVGQFDVGAEADEDLDELEVALEAAVVQRRLPLEVQQVHVDLALALLQDPPKLGRVALADRLPECSLAGRAGPRPVEPNPRRGGRGGRGQGGLGLRRRGRGRRWRWR